MLSAEKKQQLGLWSVAQTNGWSIDPNQYNISIASIDTTLVLIAIKSNRIVTLVSVFLLHCSGLIKIKIVKVRPLCKATFTSLMLREYIDTILWAN